MNKKLVLALTCLTLVFCLVFAACDDVAPEQQILNQIGENVKNANEVVVDVKVVEDTNDAAKAKITYDVANGKKTVVKETLNVDFSKDNAWNETTTTTDFAASELAFNWTVENFSELDFDLEALRFVGTLKGDDVVTKLGLQGAASDVTVDVHFGTTTTFGKQNIVTYDVSSVIISYVSSHGNDVSITITFK